MLVLSNPKTFEAESAQTVGLLMGRMPSNRQNPAQCSLSVPGSSFGARMIAMTKYLTKYLALCYLLTTITGASALSPQPRLPAPASDVVKVGLALDGSETSSGDATDLAKSCEQVSFSRNLKYGESELNVLDVATGAAKDTPRPVLLFVAGESFTGDNGTPDIAGPIEDAAMCFAARNGMVGVKMTYRVAPASPWPAGAKDVAAATSWLHQNVDLFGGNAEEIVVVGYSAGAFHVASLLAHPELQANDSDIAGVVLVSGIYRADANPDAAEKAYFGADPGKYDERSAFPGILDLDTPMLLSWSALDPPPLVAQGESLRARLCNSASHCPHVTVLRNHDNLASAFAGDDSGEGLAAPTLELVREIEVRGLP
jgi:acetyl esterase/lipase